jgi:hypothetical protein
VSVHVIDEEFRTRVCSFQWSVGKILYVFQRSVMILVHFMHIGGELYAGTHLQTFSYLVFRGGECARKFVVLRLFAGDGVQGIAQLFMPALWRTGHLWVWVPLF